MLYMPRTGVQGVRMIGMKITLCLCRPNHTDLRIVSLNRSESIIPLVSAPRGAMFRLRITPRE